jgi:hypothetical protein
LAIAAHILRALISAARSLYLDSSLLSSSTPFSLGGQFQEFGLVQDLHAKLSGFFEL